MLFLFGTAYVFLFFSHLSTPYPSHYLPWQLLFYSTATLKVLYPILFTLLTGLLSNAVIYTVAYSLKTPLVFNTRDFQIKYSLKTVFSKSIWCDALLFLFIPTSAISDLRVEISSHATDYHHSCSQCLLTMRGRTRKIIECLAPVVVKVDEDVEKWQFREPSDVASPGELGLQDRRTALPNKYVWSSTSTQTNTDLK